MKREIKYRGKCIKTGQWVYGNYQAGIRKHPHIISWWTVQQFEGDIWDEIDFAEVDPETVGQYTNYYGLEFYDGDIISVDCDCDSEYGCNHPIGMYLVVWNEETAGYALKNLNNRIFYALDNFGEENMHNIGNRWDNPDLLEGGYE